MEDIILENHIIVPSSIKKFLELPEKNVEYNIGTRYYSGDDIDYIHRAVVSLEEFPQTDEVIIDYLNTYPEKVDVRTKTDGMTPLMFVCKNFELSSFTVLHILLDEGVDVNAINEDGASVLDFCLYGMNIPFFISDIKRYEIYNQVICELLERGANTDHVYNGKSVFMRYLELCDKINFYSEDTIDLFISKTSNPHFIYQKTTSFFDTIKNNKLSEYLRNNIEDNNNEDNNEKFSSEKIEEFVDMIMNLVKK